MRGCPSSISAVRAPTASVGGVALLSVLSTAISHRHQQRTIVQSRNLAPGIGSAADRAVEGRSIRKNATGYAYANRQKVWPSVEALERDLTSFFYDPLVRSDLKALPTTSPSGGGMEDGSVVPPLPPSSSERLETMRISGNGALQMQRVVEGEGVSHRRALAAFMEEEEDVVDGEVTAASDVVQVEEAVALDAKMLNTTAGDLQGSSLESFHPLRDVLHEDVSTNPAATGFVTWDSITNLDPFIAARCAQHLGPTATRAQGRLLSALLDEDHNDVVFNAATGAGKTTSIVAAALHGVRTETAGMNILVGSGPMAVKRMKDMVIAMAGEFGGSIADRDVDDMSSWLFTGSDVLDCDQYWAAIQNQATVDPRGAHRLMIVTPEVLTELLFQHQLQFEAMGYLRRCYIDDAGAQLRTLPLVATREQIAERLATPRAVEFALMTLHQMPSPHIRALMQISAVGSTIDTRTCDYLEKAAIKPLRKTIILAPERLPSSLHCTFSFFKPFNMPMSTSSQYQRSRLFDSNSSNSQGVSKVGGQANVGDTLSLNYAGGAGSLPGKKVTDDSRGTGVGGMRSTYSKGRVGTTGNTVMQSASETLMALDHLRVYAFTARSIIPGRVLIYVDNDVNLLTARQHLRKQGMDVKVLSEVYKLADSKKASFSSSSTSQQPIMQDNWKYLLLRESEALTLDFPFVSHVFILFCPTHRRNYQHMATKATDGSRAGWTTVICNQMHAPEVRRVVEELDVNFVNHLTDEHLNSVSAEDAESFSRRLDLEDPLSNPQLLVEQHYRELTGDQDASSGSTVFEREIFGRGDQLRKEFEEVDYEPIEQKSMRRRNASLLAKDIERDPSLAADLQQQGMLDAQMQPTAAMWKWMSNTTTEGGGGSSPYLRRDVD